MRFRYLHHSSNGSRRTAMPLNGATALAVGAAFCYAGPLHAAPTIGGDESGPRVQILQPTYQDVLKGKTNILIKVQTQKFNPQFVEMFIDDRAATKGPVPLSSYPSARYDWDTKLFTDGPHKLTVRVTDTQGFRGWAEVLIYINNQNKRNNVPPSLAWLNVKPGQIFSGTVNIKLQTVDNFGVKFIIFSLNPAETPDKKPPSRSWFTNRPPYNFDFDTTLVRDGLYVLDAKAMDALEQEGDAPRAYIGISNSAINATTLQEQLDGLINSQKEPAGRTKPKVGTNYALNSEDSPVPANSGAPTPKSGVLQGVKVEPPLVKRDFPFVETGPQIASNAYPDKAASLSTRAAASRNGALSTGNAAPALSSTPIASAPRLAPSRPTYTARNLPPEAPSHATPAAQPREIRPAQLPARPTQLPPTVIADNPFGGSIVRPTYTARNLPEAPSPATPAAQPREIKPAQLPARPTQLPPTVIADNPSGGNTVRSVEKTERAMRAPLPAAPVEVKRAPLLVTAKVFGEGSSTGPVRTPSLSATRRAAQDGPMANAATIHTEKPQLAETVRLGRPSNGRRTVADPVLSRRIARNQALSPVNSIDTSQVEPEAPNVSPGRLATPAEGSRRILGAPAFSIRGARRATLLARNDITIESEATPRTGRTVRPSGGERPVLATRVAKIDRAVEKALLEQARAAQTPSGAQPKAAKPLLSAMANSPSSTSSPSTVPVPLNSTTTELKPASVVPMAPERIMPKPMRVAVAETPSTLNRVPLLSAAARRVRLWSTGRLAPQADVRPTGAEPSRTSRPRLSALPRPAKSKAEGAGAAITVAPLSLTASQALPAFHFAARATTVKAIAARYDLPADVVAACNELGENAQVAAGTKLRLPQPLQISYHGKPVKGDVSSMLMNSTSVTAFRFLFEQQGGKLEWDAKTGRVMARNAGNDVVLTIGSRQAKVNDKTVMMELAAFLMSGRTMVPVRFFEEGLHASVEWEPETGRLFVAMAN